ncbi:MAG: hypothetical protein U0793_17205 [Gemmataceae bacterium]
MRRYVSALVLTPFLFGAVNAGEVKKPAPPRVEKAMKAVKEHLSKLGGPEGALLWNEAGALAQTFPEHVFIIARYRIYPVARVLPKGLHPSNIFAVTKDDKVQLVPDIKELEKFFAANGKDFVSEPKVRDGLAAWLHLTQEFHQDGFFKFEVLEKDIAVEKTGEDLTARGRALVVGGGNGEIAATGTFRAGRFVKMEEKTKIIPGPRPICQATKLLDADPIVRKMAEADLIYMGLAAREYLMEQRGKAGPELRAAIDGVWGRIVKNGW